VDLSRRDLIRAGLGASLGGLIASASGCGSETATSVSTGPTTLWYWAGGLSDNVVAAAVKHFAPQTSLKASLIPGDYKAHLLKALTGGGTVPNIVGIKGEDLASLLPRADRFVDLNTLGAESVASEYLVWKWRQGSTIDGRLVGFPIDIGPTAMFYRADVFRRAGLPSMPAEVSARIPTWDAFIDVGRVLHRALPTVALVNNGLMVFAARIAQSTKRFIDEGNHFVGDQAHVLAAWDTAVRVIELGLSANRTNGTDPASRTLADGTVATEFGAAWHALDIEQSAPAAKGLWRVAEGPASGGNIGGSFLAIPAAGADHKLAFKIIKWLVSPVNQARGFTDAALFPSTPATYSMPALTLPDVYFGGQPTVDVFGASARKGRRAYEAPADAAIQNVFSEHLNSFENKELTAAAAWTSAVTKARALARSQGVN
jgi:cellobiose transport system substrate-binding protein